MGLGETGGEEEFQGGVGSKLKRIRYKSRQISGSDMWLLHSVLQRLKRPMLVGCRKCAMVRKTEVGIRGSLRVRGGT